LIGALADEIPDVGVNAAQALGLIDYGSPDVVSALRGRYSKRPLPLI